MHIPWLGTDKPRLGLHLGRRCRKERAFAALFFDGPVACWQREGAGRDTEKIGAADGSPANYLYFCIFE